MRHFKATDPTKYYSIQNPEKNTTLVWVLWGICINTIELFCRRILCIRSLFASRQVSWSFAKVFQVYQVLLRNLCFVALVTARVSFLVHATLHSSSIFKVRILFLSPQPRWSTPVLLRWWWWVSESEHWYQLRPFHVFMRMPFWGKQRQLCGTASTDVGSRLMLLFSNHVMDQWCWDCSFPSSV